MSKSSRPNRPNRTWTTLHQPASALGVRVSNPNVSLPLDMQFRVDVLSETERQEILQEIAKREFKKQGYDRRIRVQRYSLESEQDTACPESLRRLARRLPESMARNTQDPALLPLPPPTHIIVEEHNITPWSYSGDYAPHHIVATFESPVPVIDSSDDPSNSYVARVVLQNSIVHHINKPAQRQQLMWKLETSEHHTNLLLEAGSLLVQHGEFLNQWRSYTTAAVSGDGTNSVSDDNGPNGKNYDRQDSRDSSTTSVIVKFVRLPESALQGEGDQGAEVEFGYMATEEDRIPRQGDMPPLPELLTIIVTTSPIKSHPSTEMLERTFETFPFGGEDFLACHKVIVCDGFRQQDVVGGATVSKKHMNAKQAMRNGIVNEEQAKNYVEFKKRLRNLCAQASEDSPFGNAVVEELEQRMGYGFALRHALRHCVTTPFVCVIQHDRSFLRRTPIRDVVHAMWRRRSIKYVGVNMRSNLMYRDIFLAKYGKHSEGEIRSMVLRPPELLLSAADYGPKGSSKDEIAKVVAAPVMKSILACADAYQTSLQCLDQARWLEENPVPEGRHQLTLTPTLFWYDNTHICETAHYRDFVFDPQYKMVARGGFVEDKLSPVLKRTTERLGLTEGHARFGCFLLDDHSGYYFTGHLDGGSYMTKEEKDSFTAPSNPSS